MQNSMVSTVLNDTVSFLVESISHLMKTLNELSNKHFCTPLSLFKAQYDNYVLIQFSGIDSKHLRTFELTPQTTNDTQTLPEDRKQNQSRSFCLY